MEEIRSTPRCPECEAMGEKTDDKGVYICSAAPGYKFQVAIDDTDKKKKYDKFGRLMQKLIIKHIEGQHHE